MSARIATRRLGTPGIVRSSQVSTQRITPHTTRRALSLNPLKPKNPSEPASDPNADLSNPVIEKLLESRRQKQTSSPQRQPEPEKAVLPKSSLLHPESLIPGVTPNMSQEAKERLLQRREEQRLLKEAERNASLAAAKLDPKPAAREAWERRLVIRSLRKRGRLTRDVKLARTERQSLYKSPNLPTSVKKLTKVMNQIQGLTLEEAFVQLRFSQKKVARDIVKGLMVARDEAVVGRGMGLGVSKEEKAAVVEEGETAVLDAPQEQEEAEEQDLAVQQAETDEKKKKFELKSKMTGEEKEEEELLLPNGTRIRPKNGDGTLIELRNGKTKRVYDPTEMYIDQAWVGKGFQWKSPEYRARGKVNLLTHRTTSFSVVLKEEKTRIRVSEEIKKKRANRKLWVALPDRPITAQRQFCLW